MVFKNKLYYSSNRPDWPRIISHLGFDSDFKKFKNHRKYKIKSNYKLAYIYLRRHFGIKWITRVRNRVNTDLLSPEEVEAIARIPWIVEDD